MRSAVSSVERLACADCIEEGRLHHRSEDGHCVGVLGQRAERGPEERLPPCTGFRTCGDPGTAEHRLPEPHAVPGGCALEEDTCLAAQSLDASPSVSSPSKIASSGAGISAIARSTMAVVKLVPRRKVVEDGARRDVRSPSHLLHRGRGDPLLRVQLDCGLEDPLPGRRHRGRPLAEPVVPGHLSPFLLTPLLIQSYHRAPTGARSVVRSMEANLAMGRYRLTRRIEAPPERVFDGLHRSDARARLDGRCGRRGLDRAARSAVHQVHAGDQGPLEVPQPRRALRATARARDHR